MSINLLLADDSITIQKVIGIIFGGEEYSLTVVDNGKTAIEKARELNPDVLLIDALMPGMNGYEVCEAVRATPTLATKPILILTGSFEPFDEERAKKCGADDFLAKPFESQQILNKVRELAQLGASRAGSTVIPQATATQESPAPFTTPEAESIEVPASISTTDDLPLSSPSDIWGAFTPDVEPSADALAPPETLETKLSDSFDPDMFAVVGEESDSQLVQSTPAPPLAPQHTGTQWIPVEEQTYEFEEENIADLTKTLSDQTVPVADSGFGDIVFEEGVPAQKLPVSTAISVEPVQAAILPEPEIGFFEEPVPYFAPENVEVEAPAPSFEIPAYTPEEPDAVQVAIAPPQTTTAAIGALSEEQLKAAISEASKEVIERIVWEVVPDLAEALIREAIRKIKEGV